jgi:hypothetical protein
MIRGRRSAAHDVRIVLSESEWRGCRFVVLSEVERRAVMMALQWYSLLCGLDAVAVMGGARRKGDDGIISARAAWSGR